MTNKQIIIDGVNISRCKHYDECFNYCDQSYLGEGGLLKNTKNPKHCEWQPNCYYKQLKRKEQECEELKAKIKYMKEYIKTVENSRNEFEKENKFLKEGNKRLARVTQHKEQEYEKIKQALDEIEKTFFDTFGIEPKDRFKGCTLGVKHYSEICKKETCRGCNCEIREAVYPQITDYILLELICIAHTSPVITFVSRDVKSLKEEVLMVLCNWVNNRNIKQQVQALFKEEN